LNIKMSFPTFLKIHPVFSVCSGATCIYCWRLHWITLPDYSRIA
jgi:hypothetical protein